MRALVKSVLVVAVLLAARPAHARGIVIINTGNDVAHIRDLPADVAKESGFTAIGYRYDLFGVFWLDLWRWGGEFVAYNEHSYAPLSSEDLASLGGASMPWNYRAPPGLMIILALVELGLVTGARRRAWLLLGLGIVWSVLAALLYTHGVTIAFLIPAALGLHHIVAAVLAMRAPPEPAAPATPAVADLGAGPPDPP